MRLYLHLCPADARLIEPYFLSVGLVFPIPLETVWLPPGWREVLKFNNPPRNFAFLGKHSTKHSIRPLPTSAHNLGLDRPRKISVTHPRLVCQTPKRTDRVLNLNGRWIKVVNLQSLQNMITVEDIRKLINHFVTTVNPLLPSGAATRFNKTCW